MLDEDPLLDGETQQRWDAAIQAVNAKKRMLGAFLQESRFVGVTGHGVVLAADDLHRSVVDERENKALLESHLEEIFGRPLSLHCVPLEGDGAPPPRRDVRPLVERAREWFDGDPIGRPDRSAQRSDR